MLTIQTGKGNRHEVLFCGIGGILGTLCFDMIDDRRAADIIAEFDDPENTGVITYSDGRTSTIYRGYTKLSGYSARQDGTVRVMLAKEEQDNG